MACDASVRSRRSAAGALQLTIGSHHALNAGMIVANFGLCAALYLLLRKVDVALAKVCLGLVLPAGVTVAGFDGLGAHAHSRQALVYAFLRGAIVPATDIVFAWARDPTGDDDRCLSADACAELGRAYGPAPDDVGAPLPCGWARAADLPCIPAHLFAWASVVGCVAAYTHAPTPHHPRDLT